MYKENYKTLLRDITEGVSRWKASHVLCLEDLILSNIHSEAICRISVVHVVTCQ